MVKLGLVAKTGRIRGKKSGFTPTYRLTVRGRMVKAALLPAAESNDAQKGSERADLRNYLSGLTEGVGLDDLQFNMMLGLLDAGYVDAIRRILAPVAEGICDDREDVLGDETASQRLYDDWVATLSEEEIRECDRAYDNLYVNLSKEEKGVLKKLTDAESLHRRIFYGKIVKGQE